MADTPVPPPAADSPAPAAGGLPSPEEERQAFGLLMNIEDHPDFEPTARRWAHAYLAAAEFRADALYAPFPYTLAAFRKRTQAIYDSQLRRMHAPHPYDEALYVWSDGRRYPIGPFTDAVVKDRLLQMAPFNLTDGCWLQNVVSARPIDEVAACLFDIWADEAGNGNVEENHCNVYDALLKSVGIYLPPVTSPEFLEIDVLPSAWRAPVFELCVGRFPQEFCPELLGMTLLSGVGGDAADAADGASARGPRHEPAVLQAAHGDRQHQQRPRRARAEAIERYLAERLEDGGDVSMQQHWQRIWRGYVTWATVGFNGAGVVERALQIQGKQINIGTPQARKCWPDLKSHARRRMLAVVERKAPQARQVHGAATIGGQSLNSLFSDPPKLLELLLADDYFDLARPRASRFLELVQFGGPMYNVFDEHDIAVILDWVESLSAKRVCVDAIEDDGEPSDSAAAMQQLVAALAPQARVAHQGITLNVDGATLPLAELVDRPAALMSALVSNGWVVPGSPGRSMFLSRVISNGGPMDGVLSDAQRKVVKDWIEAGAPAPADTFADDHAAAPAEELLADDGFELDAEVSQLHWRRPFIGQGGVH